MVHVVVRDASPLMGGLAVSTLGLLSRFWRGDVNAARLQESVRVAPEFLRRGSDDMLLATELLLGNVTSWLVGSILPARHAPKHQAGTATSTLFWTTSLPPSPPPAPPT